MEQLHLLQRRAEGAASQPDISDIFTVSKTGADEKLKSGKISHIFKISYNITIWKKWTVKKIAFYNSLLLIYTKTKWRLEKKDLIKNTIIIDFTLKSVL